LTHSRCAWSTASLEACSVGKNMPCGMDNDVEAARARLWTQEFDGQTIAVAPSAVTSVSRVVRSQHRVDSADQPAPSGPCGSRTAILLAYGVPISRIHRVR
jgi:hypothetical protein